jgi:cytochrome b
VGYVLAAILALRLLWGFLGPAEARFSSFPPSPSRAIAHLRDIAAGRHATHRSHNPLGALMVYALWGTLLVVIASGVAMTGLPGMTPSTRETAAAAVPAADEPEDDGDEDWAERGKGSEGGERGEDAAEEVHEAAVNLLYLLILLHLAGVVFESRRQKANLALAMLPGHR